MVNPLVLKKIADNLRRDSLEMTTSAGSGHATSCLSCAEIISCLFFNEMSYDIRNAENPDNDEFVLSKGHAAPILYAALKKAGCIDEDLNRLRKINSALEGHPIPGKIPWIKVATGSLGQGLGIGAGMAFAARISGRKYRTYVLLGDSETSEGSVWEAAAFASYYGLDNLCAIVDVNRLGQRGETMFGHDLSNYKKKFESFGWHTLAVNGHNPDELIRAFASAKKTGKPTVIIAKTMKGRGVSFLENRNGWHGKSLNKTELTRALEEIPYSKLEKLKIKMPEKSKINLKSDRAKPSSYEIGELIATREAYGNALASLTYDKKVFVLDAEVSNSTFSDKVKAVNPEQFVECFIAEQNMISLGLGMSKKGCKVFASSFSAFLSRAHDQMRMAYLSKADMTICGSHSGVSIGEDGASQMGLDDVAMFRNVGDFVFYPSDAVSADKITRICSKIYGLKYIRTTRAKNPVIYKNSELFSPGDFKVVRQSSKDKIVIAGAGITVHEALKAENHLKGKVNCAVVDIYSIKPFNSEKFVNFVKKHGNKIVIAEDHYSAGGIGEMLIDACKNKGIEIKHLAVRERPHSGKPQELLNRYRIDSEAIIESVKKLV